MMKMKLAHGRRPAAVKLHSGKASRFPAHIQTVLTHTFGPMTEYPATLGKKMYGEKIQEIVTACLLNNVRSHSAF